MRILILGDSFTFGDEASDDETYPAYLEKMLPQAEIINMGIHGYGQDQILILLEEEGLKYHPDIVILGFVAVDMPRNLLSFRDFAKPRFVLKNGELRLTDSPVPRPEDILRSDWVRPRILDVLSIGRSKFEELTGLHKKYMEEITTAILTKMIGVIDDIHATLVLAYLPWWGEEIVSRDAVLPDEAYMFSVCHLNEKAKCFSTRPSFAKKVAQGQRFEISPQGHWGPAGHQAVAEAIRDYLLQERYIGTP